MYTYIYIDRWAYLYTCIYVCIKIYKYRGRTHDRRNYTHDI